jgi:hypothetical protein
MANREPIQYIEVDVDYCSRSYDLGLCGASLTPQRPSANSLLYSEQFDNAVWSKQLCSISANATTAPDGIVSADRLTPNAGAGTKQVVQNLSSREGSLQRIFSVFLKASSGVNTVVLRVYDQAFVNAYGGEFNLSTGIATLSNQNSPASSITPIMEDAGNGWYRCIVGGSFVAGLQQHNFHIMALGTYSGTDSFFVWGAHHEGNVNEISAYIPTTTALVNSTWGGGSRKCFNTFGTCQATTNFLKTAKTLTFINNRSNLPKGLIAYPALKDNGISAFSGTVNVAGSNPRMNAFGRRATVSVNLKDFVDDDVWFDKYQLQRISGAAQTSGIGYDPGTVGTFFTRLKARWPYYAGRPLRIIDGYVDDGILTVTQTRHFIITDMNGPDSNGDVTFEAQDVLALADDKKALAPTPSRGKLGAAVTNAVGQTFTVTPAGIEVEYPASGWGTIGSELVTFTRSGGVITLTGRGQEGTLAAAHNLGDTFQVALYIDNERVDDTIYDLLVTYAKVPASFCPLVTEWEPEITRWMNSVLLKTVITKPTGVAQLVGELSDIGVSVWWDDINQKVKLIATHPVADELIVPISDNLDIKKIEQEDFDEDRITQVHFYTKQSDPTKDYKDKGNYDRLNVLVDTEAESVNAYYDTKVREVFCRWLNDGADAIVRTLSLRLLKRLNTPPIHYTILLDAELKNLNLADVLELDSRVSTDETGLPVKRLLQIIRRTEKKSGHELEVEAQSFRYDGKYGQIMANGSPVYGSATETQKRLGAFFVGPTLKFGDGGDPYLFI